MSNGTITAPPTVPSTRSIAPANILPNIAPVREVWIKVKLNNIGDKIILESSQNDSSGNPLKGDAVIDITGKVNWIIDDNRIYGFMIRPKELQTNIWNTQGGINMFEWNEILTININNLHSTLIQSNKKINHIDWKYSLICELYNDHGPILVIDPIIRVNK